MVPFRRSAATAPSRGFVNESADVWEESRFRAAAPEVNNPRMRELSTLAMISGVWQVENLLASFLVKSKGGGFSLRRALDPRFGSPG